MGLELQVKVSKAVPLRHAGVIVGNTKWNTYNTTIENIVLVVYGSEVSLQHFTKKKYVILFGRRSAKISRKYKNPKQFNERKMCSHSVLKKEHEGTDTFK
jgi:hypothetical protein